MFFKSDAEIAQDPSIRMENNIAEYAAFGEERFGMSIFSGLE
jgi:hypothetical protein